MEEELTGEGVNLPREMMHEILSRLPVKPLCRLKMVSKSWLSLISNTNFIALHSKAIETNQNLFFQRRRVILTDPRRFSHFSLDQFLDDVQNTLHAHVPPVHVSKLRLPRRLKNSSISFILSCNGLLLIEKFDFKQYLVNPLAMKPKELPCPPNGHMCCDLYGFGYDYLTNEHKVVHGKWLPHFGFVFTVYTIQTDSWRLAGQLSFLNYKPMTTRREGVLVNRGVHWLENGGVLGFIIKEEKIVTFMLPRIVLGLYEEMELGVFRDRLCITFEKRYGERKLYNEFWVMKEYGVEESWTELRISIPYERLSHSGFWRGAYDLMKIDADDTPSLVMYNFDKEECWYIGEDSYDGCGVYVESLALLITSKSCSKRKRKRCA